MTQIEDLEKQLRNSRTELALAQKQLTEILAREARLTEARAPLLRIAKLRGDGKAKVELDENAKDLSVAHQDAADLRRAVDDIEGEIIGLERQYEEAQRELRIEQLRALMVERNRIGGVVEENLNALVKAISTYNRCADEFRALAVELDVQNTTTRGMLGTPLLRDFIQHRLKFLFPGLGWQDPQQRIALTEMEKNARESLEFSIRSSARKAA